MDYLEVTRFIISGGLAALVNLLTLYIMTEWFGWWYLASSILAFALALIVSFTLQKFWTFRYQQRNQTRRQFMIYLFCILINLLLNTALLYVLVDWLNLPYLLGQIVSGGILAVASFFVYRHWIFAPEVSVEVSVQDRL